MAYCHVCLTHVMGVRQVGPFVAIDERQSMKSFHSICGQPAMVGHIVLRMYGHLLQKTRKSCKGFSATWILSEAMRVLGMFCKHSVQHPPLSYNGSYLLYTYVIRYKVNIYSFN